MARPLRGKLEKLNHSRTDLHLNFMRALNRGLAKGSRKKGLFNGPATKREIRKIKPFKNRVADPDPK